MSQSSDNRHNKCHDKEFASKERCPYLEKGEVKLTTRHKFEEGEIVLRQCDFDSGTVRIRTPGVKVVLAESIIYEPCPKLEAKRKDAPDGVKGLGVLFFAALSVEADNVTIDLNGYSMEEGPDNIKNRAIKGFSVIEVGNTAFGIPGFYNGVQIAVVDVLAYKGTNVLILPSNTTIHNGILNGSTHFGIHTVGADNLTIKNMIITNNELAGLEISNIKGNLILENIHISGNSHGIWNDPSMTRMVILDLILEKYQKEPDINGFVLNPVERDAVDFWLNKIKLALLDPDETGRSEDPIPIPETSVFGVHLKSFDLSKENFFIKIFDPENTIIQKNQLIQGKNINVAGLDTDLRLVSLPGYGQPQSIFNDEGEFILNPRDLGEKVLDTSLIGVFGFMPWDPLFNDSGVFDPSDFILAFVFVGFLNQRYLSYIVNNFADPPAPFPVAIEFLPDGLVESLLGPNLKAENPIFDPNEIIPTVGTLIDEGRGAFGIRVVNANAGSFENCHVSAIENSGIRNVTDVNGSEFYPNDFGQPVFDSRDQKSLASSSWGMNAGRIFDILFRSIPGRIFRRCEGVLFENCSCSAVKSKNGDAFGFDFNNESKCLKAVNCRSINIETEAEITIPPFAPPETGVAYGFRSDLFSRDTQYKNCEACLIKASRRAIGYEAEVNSDSCVFDNCKAYDIETTSTFVDFPGLNKECFGFAAREDSNCCIFRNCEVNGLKNTGEVGVNLTDSITAGFIIDESNKSILKNNLTNCIEGGLGKAAAYHFNESDRNIVKNNKAFNTNTQDNTVGLVYGFNDTSVNSTTLFTKNKAVNNDDGDGDSSNYKVDYSVGTLPLVTATYTDFSTLTPESTLANNVEIVEP